MQACSFPPCGQCARRVLWLVVFWLSANGTLMGQTYTITTAVGGSAITDGAAATTQQIADPRGMVLDGDGAVIVAEQQHHRVRRIELDGTISTFAGTGENGLSGGQYVLPHEWHPELTFHHSPESRVSYAVFDR